MPAELFILMMFLTLFAIRKTGIINFAGVDIPGL